jgi:hypothetical protein
MISPETLAIDEGPAIGAASAIAGITSNAAPATANRIFRIEVSPFQVGIQGDALGDAQAVLFESTRRSRRGVVKKNLVRPRASVASQQQQAAGVLSVSTADHGYVTAVQWLVSLRLR